MSLTCRTLCLAMFLCLAFVSRAADAVAQPATPPIAVVEQVSGLGDLHHAEAGWVGAGVEFRRQSLRMVLVGEPKAQAAPAQGGHTAAELAKLKALVEATRLPAKPQGEGYLVDVERASGRKWVVLTALSGPHIVGFIIVDQAEKGFVASAESFRALLRLNESLSTISVGMDGNGYVGVSTAMQLRLADAEGLRLQLNGLATRAEQVRETLRPFAISK